MRPASSTSSSRHRGSRGHTTLRVDGSFSRPPASRRQAERAPPPRRVPRRFASMLTLQGPSPPASPSCAGRHAAAGRGGAPDAAMAWTRPAHGVAAPRLGPRGRPCSSRRADARGPPPRVVVVRVSGSALVDRLHHAFVPGGRAASRPRSCSSGDLPGGGTAATTTSALQR